MSTTRIVVGGEALVDLVPTPDGTLAPRLGGGPLNTAVAAARLGAPVAFLSRVSTDPFGDAVLARLQESGVDGSFVQRGPEPTTLAVVGVGADGSARYSFYTDGTADRLVADPGPLPGAAAVSLGTLSLVLEPREHGVAERVRGDAGQERHRGAEARGRHGGVQRPPAEPRRERAVRGGHQVDQRLTADDDPGGAHSRAHSR